MGPLMRLIIVLGYMGIVACSSSGVENPLGGNNLTDEQVDQISTALIDTINDVQSASTQNVDYPISGERACPIAGRITYSGNVSVDIESTSIYGLIQIQISDPTNNLNDCEVVTDLILDGTLTLTVSGDATAVSASLVGTLGINNRGNGGGLVPIDECFISLTAANGTVTGSICGRSVNVQQS